MCKLNEKFHLFPQEVTKLEVGVKDVTEWVLNAGEDLLSSHNQVGYDIQSAEQLRREHEALELSCRVIIFHLQYCFTIAEANFGMKRIVFG